MSYYPEELTEQASYEPPMVEETFGTPGSPVDVNRKTDGSVSIKWYPKTRGEDVTAAIEHFRYTKEDANRSIENALRYLVDELHMLNQTTITLGSTIDESGQESGGRDFTFNEDARMIDLDCAFYAVYDQQPTQEHYRSFFEWCIDKRTVPTNELLLIDDYQFQNSSSEAILTDLERWTS